MIYFSKVDLWRKCPNLLGNEQILKKKTNRKRKIRNTGLQMAQHS